MGETSMSGSTREREVTVIDAYVFHSVLSSLLYWFNYLRSGRPAATTDPERLGLRGVSPGYWSISA